MKVLLIGDNHSAYLKSWTRELKSQISDIEFFEIRLENTNTEYNKLVTPVHIPSFSSLKFINKVGLLFKVFFKGGAFLKPKNFFKIKSLLISQINDIKAKEVIDSEGFDYCVVNFINVSNLFFTHLLEKRTKVIASFWGSDLMQNSNSYEFHKIQKFLLNCSVITVQHNSMKFLLCSKFGWNLKDKIRYASLFPNKKILEEIKEKDSNHEKLLLSKKHNFSHSRTLISCGYRPIPMIQQFEIISSIETDSLDKDALFVFFWTYGDQNKEYIEKLLTKCRAKGFDFLIVEDFLSDEEIASWRVSIDLFIHCPESDALSLTLLEHLSSSRYVITFDHLPYSLLRKNNVEFGEISDFAELNDEVMKFSNSQIDNAKKNQQNVLNLIEENFNIQNWKKILK